MATFTKILGYSKDSKSYNNIACDAGGNLAISGLKFNTDGELLVSGTGGGGGGDATSANQTTQITVATNSNLAVCSRLDTIDVSTNNMEVQLDKLQFTSGNLHVRDDRTLTELQGSNLAQVTKLGQIAEAAQDTLLSVDGINLKLNALQLQSAQYTIEAAPTLAPGITPAFTYPPSGIEKSEGWYFKNTDVNQPSQVYYYSYTNPALQVPSRQFAYQLNDITCGYCVVRLLSVNATEGLPTLGIYTRPTGSGDAAPGYYKSRKVYTIPTTAKLSQSMRVMLWWGIEPSLKLHPDVARIELQLATTNGPAAGTELLAYLTVNTDSAALAGNAEYILSAAGFQYGGELIMDNSFTGESSTTTTAGDATAANQLSSNTAICNRLETLSSNIGQLYFSDSNLVVYDAASNTTLSLVKDELITLNGVYTDLLAGTAQLSVALDGTNDGVSLYAYNTVSMMPEALTLSTDSGMKALDVHLVNQISGYASESTLTDISELIVAQSAYTRFQCEIPVSDGILQTIQNNMSLTNFNVNNLTKCDTNNVVIPGGIIINNFPASQNINGTVSVDNFPTSTQISGPVSVDNFPTSFQISGPVSIDNYPASQTINGSVSIDGSVAITTASALDTHIYGSHDGSTWHHILTTPQGKILTNSVLETDVNGSLTSTSVSGTETYNALDVRCRGTTTVSGGVTSTLNTSDNGLLTSTLSGSGNSIHSLDVAVQNTVPISYPAPVSEQILTNSAAAPGQLGNIYDTGSRLNVGLMIKCSSVTVGASVYMEYSPDGTNWGRRYDSAFFNTGVNQQGFIFVQGVPARYIRAFADTGFSATGVNIWAMAK